MGKLSKLIGDEVKQILDMSDAARMQRAKDQGWDVDNKIYHGTDKDFDQFKTEKIGSGSGSQTEGWGIYFSDSKKNADRFGKNLKEIVMPEYFDGRFLNYDLKFSEQPDHIKKIFPEYRYLPEGHPRAGQERTGQEIYNQIVKESNGSSKGASKYLGRLGIVGAKFRAGKDIHAREGEAKNFVIWDQDALNDLRQSNASFDPDKIDSPSLLSGALPVGAIGAASMLSPNESYAQTVNKQAMPRPDDVGSIKAPVHPRAAQMAGYFDKYNRAIEGTPLSLVLPEAPTDWANKLAYDGKTRIKDRIIAALGML